MTDLLITVAYVSPIMAWVCWDIYKNRDKEYFDRKYKKK
jgi:hypothetical protein